MLLIATDEAGYGPRLGPLVIVATVWRLPSAADDRLSCFEALCRTVEWPGLPAVTVADSKTVFKPSVQCAGGLDLLEAATTAAVHWAVPQNPPRSLDHLLRLTSDGDLPALLRQPWFAAPALADPFPVGSALVMETDRSAASIVRCWSADGLGLLSISARVIDAASFNRLCDKGLNKAQLLSEATTALVAAALARYPGDDAQVFSDRHGGRAYYGGLLQHVLPDALLTVEQETTCESRYRLVDPHRHIGWRFTVKGDAFSPVSLSSMIAKYLRERCMHAFNRYWQRHHPAPLKPTAGYPLDADRFLRDIAPTIRRQRIATECLVRCR